MIQAVYETHLHVTDLQRSLEFYDRLGLQRGLTVPGRMAFCYVGGREHMLGLWQLPEGQPVPHAHFAFRVPLAELLGAADWLRERGIEPREAFGVSTDDLVVHTWMPAAALYFHDPDGHSLEFLALLDGEPQPGGPAVPYRRWLRRHAPA